MEAKVFADERHRKGDPCPQCDMAEEIEPLENDPDYNVICGVCGWKMIQEKDNADPKP